MKQNLILFVLPVVLSLGAVSAQAKGLPEPGKTMIGDVKMSALIDGNFSYNFNNPAISTDPVVSSQNNGHAFTRTHNAFNLNATQVGFSHDADPVGFDFAMGFGTTTSTMALADGAVDRNNAYIRKGNVAWKKDSCTFTMGRFDSGVGFEATDSVDNWNYSRSAAFSTSQPAAFTGLHYNHDFSKDMHLGIVIANGADRFAENNRGKTFGLLWNNGHGDMTYGFAYVGGPEQTSNSQFWRHTANLNMKYMMSSSMGMGVDGTYVTEKNAPVSSGTTPTRANATRFGGAGYFTTSLFADSSENLRLEYLFDGKGSAFLNNSKTTYLGVTWTHREYMSKNLTIWLEGRYDHGSSGAFYGNGTVLNKKGQGLATLAATLTL